MQNGNSGGSTTEDDEEPMTVSEAAEKMDADPEDIIESLPPIPGQPDECLECGFEPTYLESFDVIRGIPMEGDSKVTVHCPNCENHIAGDRFLEDDE